MNYLRGAVTVAINHGNIKFLKRLIDVQKTKFRNTDAENHDTFYAHKEFYTKYNALFIKLINPKTKSTIYQKGQERAYERVLLAPLVIYNACIKNKDYVEYLMPYINNTKVLIYCILKCLSSNQDPKHIYQACLLIRNRIQNIQYDLQLEYSLYCDDLKTELSNIISLHDPEEKR